MAATRARERLILSGTFSPSYKPDEEVKVGAPVSERLLRSLAGPELLELLSEKRSGSAELTVSAPAPRPGLDHEFDPATIAVEVRFPAVGEGTALTAAPVETSAESEPVATGSPPLVELEPPPAAAARLSYSALAQYQRCGYRFFVERELGLGARGAAVAAAPRALIRDEGGAATDDAAAAAEGDELLAPAELGARTADASARALRFGFGNAVHRLLEWSARNRLTAPGAERVLRVLRAEGLPGEAAEVERATAMIERWLSSPLCEELRGPGVGLRPEQPFVLPLDGALIRGSIDLFAELPADEALVIDYKTDRLEGGAPESQLGRYEVQRAIYALAASEAGRRVRTAYCFLEAPEAPVQAAFGEAELTQARERVVALLAGIAGSRFEVTDRPHSSLCGDCPARERLCSHTIEAQMRDEPEPPIEPAR